MPDASAYIDTSILGAYYCPEPISAPAEDARRRIPVPVVSTLSEVEFSSLVSRKRQLRELTARQARDILEPFESHIVSGFYRRLSLANDHFAKARRLLSAMDSSLRILDALHLAIAIAENLVLMTADQKFARTAKRCKSRAVLIT